MFIYHFTLSPFLCPSNQQFCWLGVWGCSFNFEYLPLPPSVWLCVKRVVLLWSIIDKWLGVVGCGWVWLGVVGCCWVLLGVVGCGWVWLNGTPAASCMNARSHPLCCLALWEIIIFIWMLGPFPPFPTHRVAGGLRCSRGWRFPTLSRKALLCFA